MDPVFSTCEFFSLICFVARSRGQRSNTFFLSFSLPGSFVMDTTTDQKPMEMDTAVNHSDEKKVKPLLRRRQKKMKVYVFRYCYFLSLSLYIFNFYCLLLISLFNLVKVSLFHIICSIFSCGFFFYFQPGLHFTVCLMVLILNLNSVNMFYLLSSLKMTRKMLLCSLQGYLTCCLNHFVKTCLMSFKLIVDFSYPPVILPLQFGT